MILQYTKNSVSQEKKHRKDLQDSLEQLTVQADEGDGLDDDIQAIQDQIQSVRRELKELEDARANKLIFNARVKWAHLGEKPTSYFLNLQKQRYRERTLS